MIVRVCDVNYGSTPKARQVALLARAAATSDPSQAAPIALIFLWKVASPCHEPT